MKFEGACNVEIIATGDELLFGRILDTNSNWIAKRLVEIGANLRRVTMVGDDLKDIGKALEEALNRENNAIIFTGGLGPSIDDLTVQALGDKMNRRITHDPATVKKVEEVYRLRGIKDTSRGLRMARILEESKAIWNPIGFSVGMMIEKDNRTIFTLPGVPDEMKAMFNNGVAPVIEGMVKNRYIAKTVYVRMVWKDFFPLYRKMQKNFPEIYIKNAATPPQDEMERHKVHEIKVDIVVEGSTYNEAEDKMTEFLQEYQRRIDVVGGGEIIPV